MKDRRSGKRYQNRLVSYMRPKRQPCVVSVRYFRTIPCTVHNTIVISCVWASMFTYTSQMYGTIQYNVMYCCVVTHLLRYTLNVRPLTPRKDCCEWPWTDGSRRISAFVCMIVENSAVQFSCYRLTKAANYMLFAWLCRWSVFVSPENSRLWPLSNRSQPLLIWMNSSIYPFLSLPYHFFIVPIIDQRPAA